MKSIILCLILILSLKASAENNNDKFLKNHKFWQSYKVVKNDWLWKIFRDLRDQGILSGNLADIEKEILLRNPHIKDRDKIEVGSFLLIPMTGKAFSPIKVTSQEKTEGVVNNFNFYYQPVINYPQKENPQNRELAMTRLKVKEATHIERYSSWSVEAFFSYSQLTTNVISGGEIKLTSNENYGLGIGYAIPIGWESLLNFYVHGFYEDYARPSSIVALDNPQALLKTFGTSLILPLSEDWLLATHFEIKETLYAIPEPSFISLKSTYQPYVGVLASYSLFESKPLSTDIGFQASYIGSGLSDSFDSKDGSSLRGIIENRVTMSEQNFYLQLWYERKKTKTQTTNAQADYLGLSLGWQN